MILLLNKGDMDLYKLKILSEEVRETFASTEYGFSLDFDQQNLDFSVEIHSVFLIEMSLNSAFASGDYLTYIMIIGCHFRYLDLALL